MALALLILLIGVLAPACQPATQTELLPAPAQSQPASPVSPSDSEPSSAPADADAEQASSPLPDVAPTAQVVPLQPTAATIRTELAATDPATVNLASGQPTLVEFFAFW